MRKATLLTVGALLAVPAAAHAKAGVEFDRYPETVKVGDRIGFTVMAFDERPPTKGPYGELKPIVGRRPLVVFRSESGRVLRVRAGKTDLNGLGYGEVAFPDKGPWTTELRVGKRIELGQERSQPIRVGVGLTQTIPSADEAKAAAAAKAARPDGSASAGGGFPWILAASFGAIGSAGLVLLVRRRGRWGAA